MELRNFTAIYKKQYTLAFLSHVHDELVQRKQEHTQLLKQREPPQETEVIYREPIAHYDNRKWKERFVVVRSNYSLECHESYETFMKGAPPLYKLPTTGGTILTTEEKYMEVIDKCFPDTPDTDNVKEDVAPPLVGMPGQFPVYLHLPYQRDNYFCFPQEAKQAKFISVLSDCIRHQNQDFLKKTTYEVQAFIKAVQLYRQDKGYYEPWDMMGNDVQVLANLTMEELLPCLEKDLLPRLKAKKMEKKKMWFATIEAAYNLVQETLMKGMAALNSECRETTEQQSAVMRSNMDQIMSSRTFLESKLRAAVAELATKYCKQNIEPRLPAVLEEMMGPISLGFEEARQVSEGMMEHLCQNYQEGMTREALQQSLVEVSKPNLESCYEKVSGLRGHIQEFSYPNCRGLEHSTQIDIQQLVDSVAYTFGLLLNKTPQDNTNLLDAMVKAKHRVLKQYDYDSSTQRKKIFQEALLNITLPRVKAFLDPTFKKDIPNLEQYIFDDYVNFINVENVCEEILQQILEEDISKVVKEAASMKKYNLFMESRYRFSDSSVHVTPPGTPDYTSTLTKACNALPSSPLLSDGIMKSQGGEDPVMTEKKVEPEVIMAQQEEVQAHVQPELIKVPTGEETVMAEKSMEPEVIMTQQVEVQAHAQPEVINVSAKANEEHKVEDNEVLEVPVNAATETHTRSSTPETPTASTAVVEAMLVAAQRLEEKMHPGPHDVAIDAETLVDPSSSSCTELALEPAAHTLAEPVPKPSVKANEEDNEVPVNAATETQTRSSTPETPTASTAVVEAMLVAAQRLEEKMHPEPPDVVATDTETLVDPSSSSYTELALEPAAHTLAEPVPKPYVKANEEHKVEDNEVPVNAATETQARSSTPETPTAPTAVVEAMLVAAQRLEEKIHPEPPDVVATNTETLVDPSSSSYTELALEPAGQTLAEPVPKPVEQEANETPVQASPPEGETGAMGQVSQSETSSLQPVSTETEMESAANIRIGSTKETAPGVQSSSSVQPLVVEVQTSNATGDKVLANDLASLGAPIDEVGVSNMTEDFSDDSSWTTEEEGDNVVEDDQTMETTTAIPKPEDVVKGEMIADVANNATDPSTEAAKPLDCIKDIRDLVMEVTEVEDVPQDCSDHGEVGLNTR
ncbi:protein Niban 1a isoform X2 [Neoarius graeffei]|nr:protein Niban 1a isoform X2 [Neoarius graeffei]